MCQETRRYNIIILRVLRQMIEMCNFVCVILLHFINVTVTVSTIDSLERDSLDWWFQRINPFLVFHSQFYQAWSVSQITKSCRNKAEKKGKMYCEIREND